MKPNKTQQDAQILSKRYQQFSAITQFLPAATYESYDDIDAGTFSGILTVEWHGPRKFLFRQQDGSSPSFSFTRANGEVIVPGQMKTDAGTIPKFLWTIPGFSPWEFGPAYIIHDWEFRYHTCYRGTKTFAEVNRTLLEGIKTLMESGLCEKNLAAFKIIAYSINSNAVKKHWDELQCTRHPSQSPLEEVTSPHS
ncbi:MAG: DUF1353 domain-containing protein [Desulfovibrionales bacterium]|nr:DUF1353 domain-containing protein [Desulfovibrionales bacterium]